MGDANHHATNGPSAAHRWIRCPGAPVMEAQVPDETSVYAEEGTAAHELAAVALENGCDVWAYQGRLFNVEYNGGFEADEEMCREVQKYLDALADYREDTDDLFIEYRLDMSRIVPGCWGTGDAVILDFTAGEIQVHDLKYGKGEKVDAQDNEQLMLYGLGGLLGFQALGDFNQVRTVIHQPRRDHTSEDVIGVRDLEDWAQDEAAVAAGLVYEAFEVGSGQVHEHGYLGPGEKQCRWCRAKPICPALRDELGRQVGMDFDDLDAEAAPPDPATLDPDTLAAILAKRELIREWLKSLEDYAQRELEAGRDVPGYKLVRGKAGARAWDDKEGVEALLRQQFRLKEDVVYKKSLISPTDAEKLAKAGEIGPKRYKKLQEHVTQSEGKPTLAPATDKRPAIQPDFGNLDAESAETAEQEQ